jgi:hypothetical protein
MVSPAEILEVQFLSIEFRKRMSRYARVDDFLTVPTVLTADAERPYKKDLKREGGRY